MKHVMFDLETLGTVSGHVLLSIGAAFFDIDGHGVLDRPNSTFYSNISIVSGTRLGLKVDPDTEAWWMQQSQEARDRLLTDAKPLTEVFVDFTRWIRDFRGENETDNTTYAWSHGCAFDEAMLRYLEHLLGVRLPWNFRNARDTRTWYDAANFDPDTVVREGVYHDALDDVKHQIKCVQAAYRKMQEPKQVI